MLWSRRVRALLVVVVAVSATVLLLPPAAQATPPPAGRVAAPAVAAPAVGQPQPSPAAVAPHPTLGPTAAGAVGGHSLDITLRLLPGGAAVQVTITPLVDLPAATLRVSTAQGRRELHRSQVGLGALRQGGSVRRTVALSVPAGDVGLVAAVLAGQRVVGSQFLALRRHGGGVVAAGSVAQLDDAALAADRRSGALSQAAYALRVAQAHRAPGAAGTVAAAALATTTLTVSGTASYRDRDGIARPVRDGTMVELVGLDGVVRISGQAGDDGSFTLSTSEPFGTWTVAVRISTLSPYGVVWRPSGPYWTAYSQPQTVTSGSTWSGVAIVLNGDTEANRGFAILDELRTLGAYYQGIRDPGWDVRLGVVYPSGTPTSSANRDTHEISISGGETLCTYPDGHMDWCPEDAYDWDVVAHESGHVVAFQGGFDASAGGDHDGCGNAWGTTGGVTRDKDAAVKLAWSEGWATFYGVSALWLQGVPLWAYPAAGDASYEDRPGPPHYNATRDFEYSLETGDYCTPHGDDSELAISRALWDFWDSANDGETLAWSFGDIFGRLKAAHPTTFTAVWAALSNGRSAGELDQAGGVLETWGFAPTGLQPSGTVGDSPARFSWSAGGPPVHPNDTFTLRVRSMIGGRTPLEGQVLWQVTTTATDYQPDAATWESIARAQNVIVDVSGTQGTPPASGPFWSHGYKLTILPNGRYVPVTPTRILPGVLLDYVGRATGIAPLGKGGVPTTGVSAVAFQLTGVFTCPGTVTVGDFRSESLSSTVALSDYIGSGQQGVTNLVVAKLSPGGGVGIYYSGGNCSVLVFADVVGYYVFSPQASAASTYVPLTPARILSATNVAAGGSIPVAPLGKGGIPTTGVSAVAAHVIVRSGTSGTSGNATVYPDGVTKPGTWDVFFGTRDDYYYANLVHAKLGGNGQFRISTSVAATVRVDVVGYFRTPAGTTGESTFVGLEPWRVSPATVSVPAGQTYTLSLLGTQSPNGTRGVPSTGVAAVAFTLTACANSSGVISVSPAGVTDPATGNLYYHVGRTDGVPTCWSLLQSAKVGSNGQIVLHNRGWVSVTITVDVDGYYRT